MAMSIDLSFFDQVHAILVMDSLVLDIKHHSYKNRDKFKFVEKNLYIEECMYIPKGSIY